MRRPKQRHRQFVAVIIDHTNRRVLDVWENRDQATVTAHLQAARTNGLLAQVTEATTDMWDGDVNAARAAFGPGVSVVIDRFHVVKNLPQRLVAARRELPRELSRDEARALLGSRWLWSKNFATLTAEERQQLSALRGQFPTLARLAEVKTKVSGKQRCQEPISVFGS